MSKKGLALLTAVVLMLALATTAMAAPVTPPAGTQTYGYGGCGYAGVCYSLMRDTDGNIVSKDVFEANLDAAIADGTILEADRDFFLERYEVCSANTGVCGGGLGRGNGGGRGMGRGCGVMR